MSRTTEKLQSIADRFGAILDDEGAYLLENIPEQKENALDAYAELLEIIMDLKKGGLK